MKKINVVQAQQDIQFVTCEKNIKTMYMESSKLFL